jgi:hypothetical protein
VNTMMVTATRQTKACSKRFNMYLSILLYHHC